MSIPVDLEALAEAVGAAGRPAYLLTVSPEGRAHAVAVPVTPEGGAVRCEEVGRRSRSNAVERNAVTVMWPPATPDGYTLFVDGTATVDDDGATVVVSPSRAVLHRPAPATPAATGTCGSDCVELSTEPGG